MGNTLTHRRLNYSLTGSAAPQEPDTTVYTYQRWTGRHLTSIYAPEIRDYLSYGPRDDVFNQWDAAGNLRTRIDSSSVTLGLGATTTAQPGNTAPAVNDGTTNVMAVNGNDATHHYRADGKLIQTVRNAGCVLWIDDTNNTATCTNQVPDYLRQDRTESYRYDALGRRVYVRTTRPWEAGGSAPGAATTPSGGPSGDGDQVLAEIRYPAEVADVLLRPQRKDGLQRPLLECGMLMARWVLGRIKRAASTPAQRAALDAGGPEHRPTFRKYGHSEDDVRSSPAATPYDAPTFRRGR